MGELESHHLRCAPLPAYDKITRSCPGDAMPRGAAQRGCWAPDGISPPRAPTGPLGWLRDFGLDIITRERQPAPPRALCAARQKPACAPAQAACTPCKRNTYVRQRPSGRDGAHLHHQWGELPKPTG